MSRKTSAVIRRQINKAYRKYGRLTAQSFTYLARDMLENIRLLEKDYQAAFQRETKEEQA